MSIEFLTFPGCPLSQKMLDSLRTALLSLQRPVAFLQINLEQLPPSDPRRGYGSPTILVDGKDLMGQPPSPRPGLACRVYPGFPEGLTALEIAARLKRT